MARQLYRVPQGAPHLSGDLNSHILGTWGERREKREREREREREVRKGKYLEIPGPGRAIMGGGPLHPTPEMQTSG